MSANMGWEGGCVTHDEAKVDVEQAAVVGEHEVVQVAVPYAQDVGHHAVPRAAAHVAVHHVRFQPEGSCIQA